jgi:hypothetical protein
MEPVTVQNLMDMGKNPMIPVMECPEYEVRVMLRQRDNGSWAQIWLCDSCPGWFTDWEQLRARILTCYNHAMWSW